MRVLPFAAFVGLDELKKALMVLAVDPTIGGLLIFGPKGTGKSSVVRAFAELLPEIEVVADCPFNCDPHDPGSMCDSCRARYEKGENLPVKRMKMKVVTLPIGATEDMVLGTINLERTLKEGKPVFEPGLLGRANRQILYIDEVNLLPDHIVDSILDAVASGWHVVEREGVRFRHPSKVILIGTMNPEEGELRPQLLDRFGIGVNVKTIDNPELRAEIVKRNLEFENDPEGYYEKWRSEQEEIIKRIVIAKKVLKKVKIPENVVLSVTRTCVNLEVDGYRPDIVAIKVARALAALDGRLEISINDAVEGLVFALAHRTRASGLRPPPSREEIVGALKKVPPPGIAGSVAKTLTKRGKREGEKKVQKVSFFRWSV